MGNAQERGTAPQHNFRISGLSNSALAMPASIGASGCEILLHVGQQLTRLAGVVPCVYPESPDKGR